MCIIGAYCIMLCYVTLYSLHSITLHGFHVFEKAQNSVYLSSKYFLGYNALKQIFRPREGRKEIFYLTTLSAHFIYGYMASHIWSRTIQIAREETRCRHMRYSFRLTRVLLYASSHTQDNTYHSLCYTRRRALVGTRNSSMGPP